MELSPTVLNNVHSFRFSLTIFFTSSYSLSKSLTLFNADCAKPMTFCFLEGGITLTTTTSSSSSDDFAESLGTWVVNTCAT